MIIPLPKIEPYLPMSCVMQFEIMEYFEVLTIVYTNHKHPIKHVKCESRNQAILYRKARAKDITQ